MTREKFIRIQKSRGYEVEELGKIVILRMNDKVSNYTAMWFFTSTAPDAVVDDDNPPTWSIKRPH